MSGRGAKTKKRLAVLSARPRRPSSSGLSRFSFMTRQDAEKTRLASAVSDAQSDSCLTRTRAALSLLSKATPFNIDRLEEDEPAAQALASLAKRALDPQPVALFTEDVALSVYGFPTKTSPARFRCSALPAILALGTATASIACWRAHKKSFGPKEALMFVKAGGLRTARSQSWPADMRREVMEAVSARCPEIALWPALHAAMNFKDAPVIRAAWPLGASLHPFGVIQRQGFASAQSSIPSIARQSLIRYAHEMPPERRLALRAIGGGPEALASRSLDERAVEQISLMDIAASRPMSALSQFRALSETGLLCAIEELFLRHWLDCRSPLDKNTRIWGELSIRASQPPGLHPVPPLHPGWISASYASAGDTALRDLLAIPVPGPDGKPVDPLNQAAFLNFLFHGSANKQPHFMAGRLVCCWIEAQRSRGIAPKAGHLIGRSERSRRGLNSLPAIALGAGHEAEEALISWLFESGLQSARWPDDSGKRSTLSEMVAAAQNPKLSALLERHELASASRAGSSGPRAARL